MGQRKSEKQTVEEKKACGESAAGHEDNSNCGASDSPKRTPTVLSENPEQMPLHDDRALADSEFTSSRQKVDEHSNHGIPANKRRKRRRGFPWTVEEHKYVQTLQVLSLPVDIMLSL